MGSTVPTSMSLQVTEAGKEQTPQPPAQAEGPWPQLELGPLSQVVLTVTS